MGNGNGNGIEKWTLSMSWSDRAKLFVYDRVFSAKFLVWIVATVLLILGKIDATIWLYTSIGYMGVNFLEAKFATGGSAPGLGPFMIKQKVTEIKQNNNPNQVE